MYNDGYSVADPRCLSRILIFIHPRSYNNKKRGEISCLTFFVATNFTKLKIISFSKKHQIPDPEPQHWEDSRKQELYTGYKSSLWIRIQAF
jgi:hypothetical protein